MKRNLGRLETQFLAYAQMRRWTSVRTGDLRTPMRLSAVQERKLFSRLARAGMIARVWRGLYLVPPRLPLGGKWSPDEGLALATLMAARGGRYHICGLNAFNRYGFDEQMPNRVYAYNNRLSGDRSIGSVQLTLIKVADARLGATEEAASTEGGPPAIYSSRARSLVDSVYDWSRFGSLPRGPPWSASPRGDTAEKGLHVDYPHNREVPHVPLLSQAVVRLGPSPQRILFRSCRGVSA